MKKLEWSYLVLILLPVIVNTFYLIGWDCGAGFLADNAMASYVINTIVVVLSLSVVYSCLKLFKFKIVRNQVLNTQEESGRRAYIKWNAIRYMILGFTLLFDFLASFLLADDTGFYCSLIVLIGCLFCHASEKNFQMMREPENEKKE
jgi:hypothetical protein